MFDLLEDVVGAVGGVVNNVVEAVGEAAEEVFETANEVAQEAAQAAEDVAKDPAGAAVGAVKWLAGEFNKVAPPFIADPVNDVLDDFILLRQTTEWRPQFHFTPEAGWMNDPNGLVYAAGEYHLFYQHIPHSQTHDLASFSFAAHMPGLCWGHAVSRDLVRWEHLPVALPPAPRSLAPGLPFSGCAVPGGVGTGDLCDAAEADGDCLVAVFTEVDAFGTNQRQCLAVSADRGRMWSLHEGNPVLPNSGGLLSHFRDPKVFWHAPEGRWVMALAAGDKVRFFGSEDLQTWGPLGHFDLRGMLAERMGLVPFVECPELIELPVFGAGKKVKGEQEGGKTRWALIFSKGYIPGWGPTEVRYFIGDFYGSDFTTDQPASRRFDHGPDCYATQSWSNVEGRRVLAAWMNNWHYAESIPTSPWRGSLTVPRTVSLVEDRGRLALAQAPVRELESLRRAEERVSLEDVPLGGRQRVRGVRGAALDISAVFQIGGADQVGLRVRVGEGQATTIGWGADHRLVLDRSRSGADVFPADSPGRFTAPLALCGDTLWLRVLVDRSSVEVFADSDGVVVDSAGYRAVLSALIFPDLRSDRLEVFATGGEPRLLRLEVYPMDSI